MKEMNCKKTKTIVYLYGRVSCAKDITSNTGEILTYNHKKTFHYDFAQIKDTLEEIGALTKAVKLNHSFVDRLVSGGSISEEAKDKIKSAMNLRGFSIIAGQGENVGLNAITLKPWSERKGKENFSTTIKNRLMMAAAVSGT